MNLKRIQFFLTWLKIPIELIPINLKWLIAMIGYNKLALPYLPKLCFEIFIINDEGSSEFPKFFKSVILKIFAMIYLLLKPKGVISWIYFCRLKLISFSYLHWWNKKWYLSYGPSLCTKDLVSQRNHNSYFSWKSVYFIFKTICYFSSIKQ